MAFSLSEDQYIAIYGCTQRGINVKKILQQTGFSNFLFIDQKSTEYMDETVMTFFEFESAYKNSSEKVTIFISLQNAIEHQKIAERLSGCGYDKIIFLPANPRCNEKAAAQMRRYYNRLLTGKVCVAEQIPDYREIVEDTALYIKNGVIEDDSGYVKLWMHINNIFVNKAQTTVIDLHREYYGKCLAAVDHYQAVFKYFEVGEESEALWKYMSAQGYRNSDGSFSKVKIEDRYKLWCLYKNELNRGMSFFISSAPEVIANEWGGFNICDGLHRAVFLFMRGFSYLPVKMKRELFYQKYENSKLTKIREFMKNREMTCTITPIEHPAFYCFPCKMTHGEMDNLVSVQTYLGTMNLSGLNILDWGRCECYYARNMKKMAGDVKTGQIVGVVSTETEMEFVKLLLETLDIEGMRLCTESQIEQIFSVKYDIVFLMGKKFGSYRDWLESYGDHVSWLLFLEAGDLEFHENIEEVMKQGRFDRYKVLRKYYSEQETKVLAVLERYNNSCL